MAIDSVGYSGSIGWSAWAAMSAALGTDYGVIGEGALAVSIADAGAGTVSVAAGPAHGRGVIDTLDAAQVVAGLTAPNTWYTICVRRDWTPGPGSEVTTLVALAGGSTQSLSPSRQVGAGVTDDQPIALVHRGASGLDDVVDLRCWWGNGGLEAASVDALAYLGRPGSLVRVGSATYRRPAAGSSWEQVTVAIDGQTTGTLPVARGGTGATTAAAARTNLGAAAVSHLHSVLDVTVSGLGSGSFWAWLGDALAGKAAAWAARASRWTRALRPTTDSFPSGSMVSVAAAELPASAPAGLYLVMWTPVVSGSVTTAANLRGMFGTTNTTQDQTFGVDNLARPITIPTVVEHAGGAVTMTMSVLLAGGTGTIHSGSRISAVWVGP